MSRRNAAELAYRLAHRAEAVCRFYLFNGRRQGRWWQVGDVRNTPGRSMFVRLFGDTRGPAGKWCDAATGEQVLDLLDRLVRARGRTLILVTHSAEVASRADRTERLRDGRIVAD